MLQFPLLLLAMLPTDTTPPAPRDFDALPEGEEKDELRRQMRITPAESMADPFVDSTYLDGNRGDWASSTDECEHAAYPENHYTMPSEKDLVAAVRGSKSDALRYAWSKTQPTMRVEVVGSPHKSGLNRAGRRDTQVHVEYMKANLGEDATILDVRDMAKMLNSRLQGYAFTRDSGQWVATKPQANKEPRSVRRARERAHTNKVVKKMKAGVQANTAGLYQDLNINVLYKRPGFNSRPADTLASRAAQV